VRSFPCRRLKRSHRKQVILFGLSVLLPALVLLFFIVRVNKQENELRKGRAAEARRQKAEEIGRHLAERLKKTERALLQEWDDESVNIRTACQTLPDLVFVGRIAKGELLMPWGGSEAEKLLSERDQAGQLILQAQQAELAENDLQRAMTLLNRALSSAASPSQKLFVQLQFGRILSKLGNEERARRVYRDILSQSGDLTDEYGIPFVLYAADRLSVLSSEVETILVRLKDIMEENRWLPSRALYLIRDITAQVQNGSRGSVHLERIENLRQSIESALGDLERLKSLRAMVSGWMQRRLSLEEAGDSSTWEAHGDIPWIVGIRDVHEDQAQILLAFHGPDLLRAVIEETGLAGTFPGSCRITVNSNREGNPPGGAFQGFRLLFDETEASAWARPSLPFPVLYWLILILVVGFTAFGAVLLWRDVSRELAIAEMRSQFAASVSHELKTPLTAIRMLAEALTMGVRTRPDEQKEYLRTIISESERLSRLLNNVLDFSKIEQGTRTYRFEAISLEDIIHAAEKAMAFPLNQKGFSLQVEVETGIPPVLADRDALEQAVLNLLHNAMKYSGESREILLRLRRNGNMACIDVIDHGIGIAEENKSQIFGKFFRVPGAENQRIPGTGLGLTIVSHIAESHGGRVDVISRPGEGSTFSILLPLEAG
jgi:signal transduction histidine kinase